MRDAQPSLTILASTKIRFMSLTLRLKNQLRRQETRKWWKAWTTLIPSLKSRPSSQTRLVCAKSATGISASRLHGTIWIWKPIMSSSWAAATANFPPSFSKEVLLLPRTLTRWPERSLREDSWMNEGNEIENMHKPNKQMKEEDETVFEIVKAIQRNKKNCSNPPITRNWSHMNPER